MTVKTSTIEDILGVRPYDGQNGRTYYYDILLANGDKGSIGKKSDDALTVGQSLTYTAEEGKFGLKIKEHREFGGAAAGAPRPYTASNGAGAGSDRNASFALAYAKDIAVALIARSEKPVAREFAAQVTIEMAEKFLTFLNDRK